MDVDEFGELNEWEDRLDVLPVPAWCVGDAPADDEAGPTDVDMSLLLLPLSWVIEGSPPVGPAEPEVDAE